MTTATLAFEHRPIRIDVDDIWLRPGLGAHELRIQLKVHAPWLPATPADAAAVLIVHADLDADVSTRHSPLGQANAVYHVRHYPTTETLSLLLADQQLHALEELASSDGLYLQLDLTGALLVPTTTRLEGASEPVAATVQLRHRVTRSRWHELLDQAGATVAITVRVPSPLTDPNPSDDTTAAPGPSASRAAGRLRQARRALADGDHEGCVQACRAVLEHVRTLQAPAPVGALKSIPPAQRDGAHRWAALFHDAYSLTSAAAHDDDNTLDIHWSRADAQAVLALTAGMLARVSPQP